MKMTSKLVILLIRMIIYVNSYYTDSVQDITQNTSKYGIVKNLTCIDTNNVEGLCRAPYFCYKLYGGETVVSMGCINSWDLLENLAYCKFANTKTTVLCCDSYDFCNKGIELTFSKTGKSPHDFKSLIAIVSCAVITVIFSFITIIIVNMRSKSKVKKGMLKVEENQASTQVLEPQRVANEVELFEKISSGRYGAVYHGFWRGQSVAAKIFNEEEKSSWLTELKLMQTQFFGHPNILTLFIADKLTSDNGVKYWLLTEYHGNGSLYDYLQRNEVTKRSMLKMAVSIAFGLEFLHAHFVGVDEKPSIAHRDIKSKNILVKNDHTCCIGDFGLSISSRDYHEEKERLAKKSVGTIRYMAPEILSNDPESYHFEVVLSSDVYSVGLVFWELLCRTSLNPSVLGSALPHNLPYYEHIPNPSTIRQAKEVICEQKIRPTLPPDQNDRILKIFGDIITMCWTHAFSARIRSITIKKNINKLYRQVELTSRSRSHNDLFL